MLMLTLSYAITYSTNNDRGAEALFAYFMLIVLYILMFHIRNLFYFAMPVFHNNDNDDDKFIRFRP